MKKILIPIDFSACATNAVQYAIQLARIAEADVHLCHAIVPVESYLTYGFGILPPYDDPQFILKTEQDLSEYADKLIKEEKLNIDNAPTLTYSFANGALKELIENLTVHHQFDMIVMGLSGAGSIERFIIGSTSRAQIEQAKIPLLLIPRGARFNRIKKIAFATDLNLADMDAIQQVARLFCRFDPELLLSHIDSFASDFQNPASAAHNFLKSVTGKINYSKIYYRQIQQKSVQDGLVWLTEKGQIEMMAMVHRHKGMLETIMNGSNTQRMAKCITLPLLVLPESYEATIS